MALGSALMCRIQIAIPVALRHMRIHIWTAVGMLGPISLQWRECRQQEGWTDVFAEGRVRR